MTMIATLHRNFPQQKFACTINLPIFGPSNEMDKETYKAYKETFHIPGRLTDVLYA